MVLVSWARKKPCRRWIQYRYNCMPEIHIHDNYIKVSTRNMHASLFRCRGIDLYRLPFRSASEWSHVPLPTLPMRTLRTWCILSGILFVTHWEIGVLAIDVLKDDPGRSSDRATTLDDRKAAPLLPAYWLAGGDSNSDKEQWREDDRPITWVPLLAADLDRERDLQVD